MTTTETLRTLINAANPELLEIKAGCEIPVYGGKKDVIIAVSKGDVFFRDWTYSRGNLLKDYGILGTPPDLSHLLIAIRNAGYGDVRLLIEDQSSYIFPSLIDDDWSIKYDLTKPPLQQTLEVQEALVDILRK